MAVTIRLSASPERLFAGRAADVWWEAPASAGPPCSRTNAAAAPVSVTATAASGPNLLAGDLGLAWRDRADIALHSECLGVRSAR